jgi:hypothetical protein
LGGIVATITTTSEFGFLVFLPIFFIHVIGLGCSASAAREQLATTGIDGGTENNDRDGQICTADPSHLKRAPHN